MTPRVRSIARALASGLSLLHGVHLSLAQTSHEGPLIPTAIRPLGPRHVELRWPSQPGAAYQLEVARQPGDAYRGHSPVRHSTGQSSTWTEPIKGALSRFYRVRRLEPEAQSYLTRADITDPVAIQALNAWIAGLKALGLWERARYQATLRMAQNLISKNVLLAINGGDGTFHGPPAWTEAGIVFNGQQWVSLPNPLRTTHLAQFSLFCVFDSDRAGGLTVFGSDGARHGPVLFCGGSPMQGAAPGELCLDYAPDGLLAPPNPGVPGRRTFSSGNPGYLQAALATFSPTLLSCQTDIDHRYASAATFAPAWNGNPDWQIGARMDGSWPFFGTISFVALFDAALSQPQYDTLRRLYLTTLGAGLPFPPANLIIEGDSLSEEGFRGSWGTTLLGKPNWQGRFKKRNVAKGGERLSQMWAQFHAQVAPYAIEPGRNYLFLWGGANDMNTTPAVDMFQQLTTYWRQARHAGFKVVAFTILPTTGHTPAVAAQRERLNGFIRANAALYDHLIDVAALLALANPADRTYYTDGIHLSPRGIDEVANLINVTIPQP